MVDVVVRVAPEVMAQQLHRHHQRHLFAAVGLDALGQLGLVTAVDAILEITLDVLQRIDMPLAPDPAFQCGHELGLIGIGDA